MTSRLIVLGAMALTALADGPALHVDAAANRHPISPDIYGINFNWDDGDTTAAADVRATSRRWGGNSTSTYHWKFDTYNHDADWFYEVLPDTTLDGSKLPDNSSFNQMFEQVPGRAARWSRPPPSWDGCRRPARKCAATTLRNTGSNASRIRTRNIIPTPAVTASCTKPRAAILP
jgi:hypothetical protein